MDCATFLSRRSARAGGPGKRAFFVFMVALGLLGASGCALIEQGQRSAPSPAPEAASQAASQPQVGGLPLISEVMEAVRPAVVFITTRQLALDFSQQPTQQGGAGSGVLFDARGYIITNNHVVENADTIQVALPDGRTFDRVKLIGRDPPTDLAVLKIEGRDLPAVPLGDSDTLRVGDWVIAIGNSLALEGGPTVTAGVVGAVGRSIRVGRGGALDDMIQTDAAINPGNSGGPLINLSGEVVGINTAIDTRGQGIGFAISMNSARPIIEELIKQGRVIRPFLGVNVAGVTPSLAAQLQLSSTEGAVIAGVSEGGPAARAGLQAGDVITELGGEPVKNVRELVATLRRHKPGDKVEVTFQRAGNEQTLTVTLEEMSGG